MASDLEKSAKEAFIDDHYELAIDLYSQAIALDPLNAQLFADRAQANIKLQNFTDANKAIELNPKMANPYFRKGLCSKATTAAMQNQILVKRQQGHNSAKAMQQLSIKVLQQQQGNNSSNAESNIGKTAARSQLSKGNAATQYQSIATTARQQQQQCSNATTQHQSIGTAAPRSQLGNAASNIGKAAARSQLSKGNAATQYQSIATVLEP